MAIFKDSLGNRYSSVPNGRKPTGGPKSTKSSFVPARSSRRKLKYKGNMNDKYVRYRALRGRPNGPGQSGNKSGKNKIKH